MEYTFFTAPCGVDCFNCRLFDGNGSQKERKALANKFRVPEALLSCKGCRAQNGCPMLPHGCETLACTREKKVTFCFQCDEFPCQKLQPMAEGAEKYPHNFKLFNLLRIQKVGVKKWAAEESKLIRERYFNGKFLIGAGPILLEEEEKEK